MSPPSTIDWSLADGHGYVFHRSHIAACRLNLQHYLWKEALGFTIYPSIHRTLSPNSVVADVATGTAAWLLDVARDFPQARLHGFDNDVRQAPHQRWLPENVSVRHWDIFDDLPLDLVGKFDFVHVRLLVLVLKGNNQAFIGKLLKMLRPGGYLQWDELDCVHMHVKGAAAERAPALTQIRKMSWANGRYDWTVRIGEFLREAGFRDVETRGVGDAESLVRAFHEQHLLTMTEFAESLVRMGEGEGARKLFGLIEQGEREAEEGAALCIPRVVCVARKEGGD
ncbi:hypothetical protein EYC80_002346 [Monilinia laxa]|uniref:Methyltransferase domain-containing protein n=1 Tax=Monilinia laxa TaxID=61186 RepID=A0A5N6K3I4_MONLA|nr:hypothetical protein EYC80_002346 [Monilinia laxa]